MASTAEVSGSDPVIPLGSPRTAKGLIADRDAVDKALGSAREHLLNLQRQDGHWCGELQGDTILESEFVLLLAFLDRPGDPRIAKCGNYLLAHQQADGGWNNYPGGPTCIKREINFLETR